MPAKTRREVPLGLETDILRRHLEIAGGGGGELDEIQCFLDAARGASSEAGANIDRFLIEECIHLRQGLTEATEVQKKLRNLHEEMAKPPWYPAIYQGALTVDGQSGAMVHHGGSRRVVSAMESVDLSALAVGDEVLLDGGLNLVVGQSSNRRARTGETALFDRYTPDGHMVLNWHDEEIVVDVAAELESQQLSCGDRVRFDRTVWMAFERIARPRTSRFLLEETPVETFEQIGGLDDEVEKIQQVIGTHLRHPEIVERYKAQRKGSILLVGVPGNGKTMIARATANWLAGFSATGVRFMNIKPAELHSMWYSQTEANYREVFEVARALGQDEPDVPLVMFFDEVDAIGTLRGRSVGPTDDRVLNALMTELDGLNRRGNVLVMAATNRVAALDPGLARPGRLGDLIVPIPRPGRKAARQIFSVYMERDIPFASEWDQEGVIGAALTLIYGPNSDNVLAKLMLRGGKQVPVRARDLISGAGIRNIVNGAKESAILREATTGNRGLGAGDVMGAIDGEFASLVGMLTPDNCRSHMSDLPEDADVVRIERVERRPKNSQQYLTVV